MNRVSLVCTVHVEMGLANVSALGVILESIQPEVIFLEVPPEAFDDYYENCSRQNLESMAVRQYRAGHQVELVPVDLPTPEREFFESHEHLHDTTRETSAEYRRLLRSDSARVRAYGFAYLNCEHCSQLRSDIDEEMLNTIRGIGDSRLLEIYESWMEKNNLRENAWIENIQNYCRENTFSRGVFLVGAAHRQPIIEKSRKQTAASSTRIAWDFTGHMNQQCDA
jgi:hypothetical protein